jgi:NADH:ubiquinone oxidoreductase subunit E
MHVIRICTGGACMRNYAEATLNRAEKILNIKAGETSPDGCFRLEKIGCLGQCSLAPNVAFSKQESPLSMLMNLSVEGKMHPNKMENRITELKSS